MALPTWMIAMFIVVGAVIVLIIGVVAWLFIFRKKKQYPFLLYSRDLERRKVIHASLKADPQNRENKKFFFPGVDTQLPLKEPTCFQSGVAYREIIQNKDGGYSYIKGTKLDEKDYIELSLTPDEKSLALHRIKENEVRYQHPISKTQAAMIITGFIMIIILVIGIIYSTIAYVGAGKDVVKVVQANKENTNAMAASTGQLAQISAQQAAITAALTKENNIETNFTRQIS